MPALAFVANKNNLNSIAVLTGALEADPRTQDVALHFPWQDERLLPRLAALAEASDLLVVALSFATADVPGAADLLRGLRALQRPPTVVAGGPHPSARPREVLQLGAGAVVVGEGEDALPALVARLVAGESVEGMPGVAVLAPDGSLLQGPRPDPIDLDAYPPLGVAHRRFGPIEITRGCPCACAFCQTSFLFGGRMRHRSVENAVGWVERAMAAGYSYVRFVTPNAFAYQSEDNGRTPNLDAMERLLRAMAALVGREQVFFGTFPSEVGPETVTPEAVALVRRYCGNDNLIFGAQTGSDRLLRKLRRNHTVADVYQAADIVRAAGLTPVVDMIFGLPGEKPEDVAATLRLMEDLVARGAVLHTHTFMPLPGTPLEDAPPGEVDPALHPLLDRMASQGHQVGQWRKQEELARQSKTGARPRDAEA
ncbi:MAG: TIGR04013 family B12-binding domain/radical SAM domain-containing protein [Anaerolineae bacterium]|nr:TIGR04013 family B12-binding domain/radical SAM domain-containing protein [Anaerolineae bacterium]